MKAEEARIGHWDQRPEEEEVFVMHIFSSRDNAECFFLLFLWGIDKVAGRHAWKKADMSGGRWAAEDSIMFFIHTPVFTVSFGKQEE